MSYVFIIGDYKIKTVDILCFQLNIFFSSVYMNFNFLFTATLAFKILSMQILC